MAEILHQLIGSSSQYLKGFSTIPGGFLAGFLVTIFPVFYDDILGPRDFYDFQYPVVSQTHSLHQSPQATAAVARPSGSWLPSPDPTTQQRNITTAPPWLQRTSSNRPPNPEARTSKASTFWVKFCIFLVTSNCPCWSFRRVLIC